MTEQLWGAPGVQPGSTHHKNKAKSRNRRLQSDLVNIMKTLFLAEYLNVYFSKITSIP